MDAAQVTAWIGAYERAWRTAGTDALDELFGADAIYSQGPYDEPVTGLASIKRMWEAERAGLQVAAMMASMKAAVSPGVSASVLSWFMTSW